MDPQDVWQRYFSGRHEAVLRAGASAAEIMHITGLSLVALGRFDEAVTLFDASLHASPNPIWYSNASIALLEAGQVDQALQLAREGRAQFEDANLCFCEGNALLAKGEAHYIQAIQTFLDARAIDPNHWEATMNLANTLRRIGHADQALTFYRVALGCVGDDVDGTVRIQMNMAVTLSDIGRDEEALALFEQLAATGTILSPEMDFNRATLRLKLGDYEGGWKLYESRWQCQMSENERFQFRRPMLENLSDGEGKRVLFCHEQGYGDSIQFVRYAHELEKAGLGVRVLCPAPLARLFDASGITVFTSRDELDEYDFECPMLNAPKLLGTTLDTIPGKDRYLFVPKEFVELHEIPSSKNFKVGLVWAGQMRDDPEMAAIDRKRSIAAKLFLPLLDTEGVDFFNLQFGERANDLGDKLPPALQESFDFLDTAAIIEQLDLVITVDTSVAHLSGALGKPTWILSRKDGCWRWLAGREDSPWYKSVKLFHQRDSWEQVLTEVKNALEQEVNKHHPK